MRDDVLLEITGMDKSFPGVHALDNVDLTVKRCEIHGIVGENGAGKSTLMKIISGIYQYDKGTIVFDGKEYHNLTTKLVEEMGIRIIHQERLVVPYLTVAESLFLGIEPVGKINSLNRKQLVKKAEQIIFETIGVKIPGDRMMSEITVAEQQLVQICRALMNNPKLIIFDEPTAVLAQKETKRLFEIIRELKKKISVIYISHYFGEILDLCDAITVLKNGKKVADVPAEGMTVEKLVVMMVGKDVKNQYPTKNTSLGDVVLDVHDLTKPGEYQQIDLSIRAGEILGLTGLMGSGHEAVGKSIFYNAGYAQGTIAFRNRQRRKNSTEAAVRAGIGFVSENRREESILQVMSVKENITLPGLNKVSLHGIINCRQESQKTKQIASELSIKTPSIDEICGLLSGGNQQKVVIGKWINADSKLLILNQPTAGVDIGARAEIYSIIHEMAANGCAVLLISQDIQEIVGLSNRVITMFRGRINHEFLLDNPSQDYVDAITVAAMGGGQND